jgi:anti-anti-sigma regulatory factor
MVEDLDKRLLALGQEKLNLDFGNVESVTAAALGKLVSVRQKQSVALYNVRPEVREVFEVAGLSGAFEFRGSGADAATE